MIRLHDFPLSSASYRVRIALNLKGVAYERRNYVLRGGEQRGADYLAINPAGLVPCLEIDGLRLTQSLAIVEYLDSRFPEPRLIPQDPTLRARAQAMAPSRQAAGESKTSLTRPTSRARAAGMRRPV